MKQEIDMSKYTIGIDPYDKQETLEEVAENFWLNDDSMTDNDRISYVNGFVTCAKWQQSYSEEEVLDITKQAYAMGRSNYTIEAFNNWFKQFKKI